MRAEDYFTADAARHDLKQKTVRGGVAIGLAQVASIAIQLISIPILSRLLDPEAFGIVAAAMLFTGFAQLFIDAGLSAATVQRPDLRHEQSSNLFWFAAAIGGLLALITLISAPLVGMGLEKPAVGNAMAALSLTFLLSGLTVQHTALMRRVLRFSTLSIIRVSCIMITQSVTIYLAWRWHSYWALVVGQIVQGSYTLATSWIACRWRPSLPSRGVGTRGLLKFGANLSGARLVNYVARRMDQLVVAGSLGTEFLGFYERATRLWAVPIENINNPLTSVLLPALSRLVDNREKYRRTYLTALSLVLSIGFPIVAFATIDADRLVPLVLGPGWSTSVPIFQALAPAAFGSVFSSVFSWVHVSQGQGGTQLRWQTIASVLMLTAVLIGGWFGSAISIALAYSTARILILPLGIKLACSHDFLTAYDFLAKIAPIALATLVATVVTLALRVYVPLLAEPSVLSACLLLAAMAASYLPIVWLLCWREWRLEDLRGK